MARVRATWAGGPNKTSRWVEVPTSLQTEARRGMKLLGSEMHDVAFGIRPSVVQSDVPADPVPDLAHQVILPPELREELEVLVIEPSLDAEAGEVMVVFTGITGAGKTTVKQYCVAQVADRCDGKIAYFDLPPGYFRRMYWGESELVARSLFESCLELGEQGYVVFLCLEDAEATLQSRRWSQNSIGGCGTTAAATTSALLAGIGKLAAAKIKCTVLTSSNYFAFDFDPALMSSHRLRGYIVFGTLDPALAPEVVRAHAANVDVSDEVVEWMTEAFCAPTVLARGKHNGSLCEVTIEDCLTPSLIAGVFHRARLFSRRRPVELEHAARAFAAEVGLMANKIAAHSRQGGEIGMLVPRLADASGLSLTPVFDAQAVTAQAAVDGALAPA